MKSISSLLFTTFTIFCVSCQTTSSNPHSESDASSSIDSLVRGFFNAKEFSGSVLVAEGGEIIYNKHYGYAKLDSSKRINSESVFEIASLTKQFSALLIMILKEEGKLNYDDMVSEHVPNFPYDDITVRHILTHTSGLSERKFFQWAGKNMNSAEIYTNEFILDYLVQQQPALSFNPGEKWEYSNLGYFLLPLIIEQLSGQVYIEYLKDKILTPLEMTNTGIFAQEIKGSSMANYTFGKIYNPKDTMFVSGFGMAKSDSIYGSVGLLSNTSDLFKWDRALYSDKLVDQESLQEAFGPYTLTDGTSTQYGFGWFVRENYMLEGVDCGKRLDHYGLWPGYETSIVRYIDRDITIIILANQSPSAKDKLVEEISILIFHTNDADF